MANIRSTVWYVNFGNGTSTGYYAVSQWAVATYTVGQLVIPKTAPAVGNERVYVCTKGGLSVGEPSWTFTKGAKQTDSSTGVETFQECTGQPGVCGDATNTPIWTASSTWTLGQVITNIAGTGWFICATAGTNAGGVSSQPAGLTTPVLGVTTTDASTTWTCIATAIAGGPSNAGGPYAAWNAPHARIMNAFTATWGAAGDAFYVGDNHAETQSTTLTITGPGTAALPTFTYCCDHTVAPPTTSSNLKTTATITTTVSNNNLNLNAIGYFRGITFANAASSGGGITLGSGTAQVDRINLDACAISLTGTSTTAIIAFKNSTTNIGDQTLNNTTLNFSQTGQGIQVQGRLFWRNTPSAIGGAAIPSNLFLPTTQFGIASLDGVDLSAITSGNTLFGVATSTLNAQMTNCKLAPGVTVAAAQSAGGAQIDIVISDSGANAYRQERYRYEGTLTTSTTIYNNATDGVTPISWQVITTANANRAFPFECFQIAQWVAAGTFAASLVQITSATAGLTNADVWVEAEYLGNASFPIASLVSSAPANLLTAGSSLAAGSWAVGGLGNNYQLAIPSFTTNLAGYVRFTVKVAKASLTVNVDPAVTIA